MYLQSWLSAAMAVVPVPINGSSTIPDFTPLTFMHSSASLTGNIAGCLPFSSLLLIVSYGIYQQLPLSLRFGLSFFVRDSSSNLSSSLILFLYCSDQQSILSCFLNLVAFLLRIFPS